MSIERRKPPTKPVYQDKLLTHIRREFGLRVIKMGTRSCLRCDKVFYSPDLACFKVCDYCRRLTDCEL